MLTYWHEPLALHLGSSEGLCLVGGWLVGWLAETRTDRSMSEMPAFLGFT